ncbi:4'-phosphopantetheinyl transferase superfamily protein [Alteromonas sp. 1_MG-2023]|uniref:4'-phosphopantetheinyl transferase family protein n=1 Tax=Alteromonas sp. 1_MG-2023 TaxID=3062669 RepID=UPI0026E258BA|nr:4'-phosphopantetheinyl transferase superfamily protein [Alteromonas sp. 1_MG-2023]MDO6566978.1 4'-phosphopantetheinyl transferase superfamily protein [Alteromonas sp. 1_MG-2023]
MQINHNNYVDFQLWETKVENDAQHVEVALSALLSKVEHQKLNTIGHENKRREYVYSRALIRHALSQIYDLPTKFWVIREVPNSSPMVENLPSSLKFSLSHSNKLITFATSLFPVGVDVEKIKHRANMQKLAKLFMTEKEYSGFESMQTKNRLSYFYQTWSEKEAYFKALDAETQQVFKYDEFDTLETGKNQKGWRFINKSDTEFSRVIALNTPN